MVQNTSMRFRSFVSFNLVKLQDALSSVGFSQAAAGQAVSVIIKRALDGNTRDETIKTLAFRLAKMLRRLGFLDAAMIIAHAGWRIALLWNEEGNARRRWAQKR